LPFGPRGIAWALTGLATVVASLAIGGWSAGQRAGALEQQRLDHELSLAEQELTESRRQTSLRDFRAADNAGSEIADLRRQVLQLQAESNQYRSQLNGDIVDQTRNGELLAALRLPNVQLKALCGAGATAKAVAYVLIAAQVKLILIASGLPTPRSNEEYQLWGFEKEGAAPESLGLFSPDTDQRVYFVLEDISLARDFAIVAATVEPLGGSVVPSGTKVLSSECGNGR
jgi:Anti-sigma-K factor rskA